MTAKTRFFLALPFIWFIYLWLEFVFRIHINIIDVDDALWGSLWFLMLVFGTPITLITGLIYTYLKKQWGWFSGYVLGGFPIIYYFIAVLIY